MRKRQRSIVAACACVLVGLSCGAMAHGGVGSLADSSGELVAWGDNSRGQTSIPPGSYSAAAGGESYTLALRSDGTLTGWGNNANGQLNVPDGTYTALATSSTYGLAIRTDGTLAGWGYNNDGETNVPAGTYTAVAAGWYHGLAVDSDGILAAWGWDAFGDTVVPEGTYSAVAAGALHSLAIRNDGTLAGWGNNVYGQTVVPTGTYTKIAAGDYHGLALASDGTLAGWGYGDGGLAAVPNGTFTAIAAGWFHNLALRSDGTLAGWGDNTYGQVIVPSGIFAGIAAGPYDSFALRARTDYDGDLLVSGSGLSANLNRSINVAGNATIQSTMSLYNNPVMAVGGKMTLSDGAGITGNGIISVAGDLELPSGAVQLNGNLDVVAASLRGGGQIGIDGGARLTVAPTSLYNGDIWVNNGSVSFNGAGIQTAGSVNVSSAGQVRLGAGQRLSVNGDVLGGGLIMLAGSPTAHAELDYASLSNLPMGLISGHDATIVCSGSNYLYNQGALALTGGQNDIVGKVSNYAGGTITITGGASAVFYDDVIQNGTLTVRQVGSVTSTAVFLGSFSGSGGFTGGGSVFIEGDLRPGNSPASVLYDGNMTLGAGSHTQMELAGTLLGSQYDHVNITGQLALDGQLDVVLLNDFSPAVGDSFNLFDGQLTGTFQQINLPALASSDMYWDSSRLYTEGTITVVPEPSMILGASLLPGILFLRIRKEDGRERS